MSQIMTWVLQGWPGSLESLKAESYYAEAQTFWHKRTELSVHDGCLLWGTRVVVPSTCRSKIATLLHEGHQGICKMKALARSYLWWPGIDRHLETIVKGCNICQELGKSPTRAPLQPWEWPDKPWSRLHVDYAGPLQGQMLLILVDAYSKWMDVHAVSTATTQKTVEKIRESIVTHGIPDSIVSDNGSCFTSNEFQAFCTANGIQHIRVAPYHPSSNGLVERAVQTLKGGLAKMRTGTFTERLQRFLMAYRNTPHATTGISPAELLMGRRPKTLLDLLRPNLADRVKKKQLDQKYYHDKTSHERHIGEGQAVFIRNFRRGPPWIPAEVIAARTPLSYDCRLVKRHIDHVKSRFPGISQDYKEHITQEKEHGNPKQQQCEDDGTANAEGLGEEADQATNDNPQPGPQTDPQQEGEPAQSEPVPTGSPTAVTVNLGPTSPETPAVRRSTRIRKPPDKLDL